MYQKQEEVGEDGEKERGTEGGRGADWKHSCCHDEIGDRTDLPLGRPFGLGIVNFFFFFFFCWAGWWWWSCLGNEVCLCLGDEPGGAILDPGSRVLNTKSKREAKVLGTAGGGEGGGGHRGWESRAVFITIE